MNSRQNRLIAGQALLLALVIAVAVVTSEAPDWRPAGLLAALLALALFGEFISLRAGSISIGTAFLATALAMALLGPAPAALIAVLAVLAQSVRDRLPRDLLLSNVVTFATYPVVGGLVIEALHDPAAVEGADLLSAVVVFLVYLPTNLLNFLGVVGYLCLRDRTSLLDAFRRLYLPVVPWEVATALLTAATVLAYQELGLLAVGLLGIVLVVHQSLLRAVVQVERQRDELQERMDELEALHRGVVRVLVETLSMRDEMTARHSAAVARFARATARAAGCSERDQELVRVAGLLHDVGKFTFPDATLTSRSLSDDDWALIRSHPQRGADIVRRVRGYGEVADVILAHHERVDGGGYPRGLAGEAIPQLARIISIADSFDVMTARDSYREPISIPEAIADLRRVAGSQLDAELVEIFVVVVEVGGVVFTHADNEDLERELTFEVPDPPAPGRFRRRSAPAAT